MYQLVIKNAMLFGGNSVVDVGIKDGKIHKIAPNINEESKEVINANNKLLIPGFIDAHTHLEKTFTLDQETRNNTLEEAINSFMERFKIISHEDIQERARKALKLTIANGTTAMRTHLVIDPRIGIMAIEAVDSVKKEFAEYIDLQLVAMAGLEFGDGIEPQNIKLLELACESGADLLGGAPTLCANPFKVIDQLFAIAKSYELPIDFHIDEMDNPSAEVLEYLADKTIKEKMQGKVTAGHCCSLSAVADEVAVRVIDKVKEAQINIVTLPSSNVYLMGRNDRQPVRRGLTRVKELMAAGVNVCYAGDNVRDPFVPFGNGDMLEEALVAAKVLQMGTFAQFDTIFAMGTFNAAKTMALQNYGVTEGCNADLVILDAQSIAEAIIAQATKNYVIKKGKVVAKTTKEVTIY